ncbi:putative dehydrogenase [Paenibacillus phyllosphaerae]|uniref:Putative dehydrogenase n=1 Tax=Paenibacillus phyllosphaerae TaxID=274593 RepID=A0A7W5FRF9_9BACL|nr:oxidoreductase [Paenibacillus phyllosphaerae]MBB3114491.1 putative dehydrogenase [Paenibacillus phyllosphaerae]
MSEPLRVGLIGYGYAGRTFHAPIITAVPELKLTKVVERSSSAAKDRYPWVKIVDNVNALYEDDEIDLIVVTTPSTDHYTFVRDALSAGKHVVVEKPFTVTSAEADELTTLARESGKVLSVFHNRRWDGDFLTMKQLLQQNLLGTVMEAEFHWDGYDPVMASGNWREHGGPGTGVFYDLGVHFLDQALSLFGMPETIAADIRVQRENALAHDYFDVVLGYPGGLKVSLKSSRYVREPGPRYRLYGTQGSFIKYGTDPQESALIRGETPATQPGWGQEKPESWGKLNTSVGSLHVEGFVETLPGDYRAYYRNVYKHIMGEAELAVTADEARASIRLIELAFRSNEEGRIIRVDE